MDISVITQLVGSLGFPIVCCGALFWKQVKSEQHHTEEMLKISEALNNNTLALQKLTDSLSVKEK